MSYRATLASRNYNFSAQVSSFVLQTNRRMTALVRQSTGELVNIVQTTANRGGHMRVDTGFLRASGQLSLSGLPSGPTRGRKRTALEPKGTVIYPTEENAAELTLAGAQVGGRIYFGWTAHYAKYREAYDGFLFSGVQRWPAIVQRNCLRIRAASPAGGRDG